MFRHNTQQKSARITPLIAAGAFMFSVLSAPTSVFSLSINDQIQQKQAEHKKAQEESKRLGDRASDTQSQIDQLQAEIADVQAQIDINTARQKELTEKIEAAQKRLDEQRGLLSANIRSMYIEGEISPLEMIASSKNLGDFVEKQEYRDRIKDNISTTMDEIEGLKKQLDAQRNEVIKILDTQKELRGTLDEKNNEASKKLSAINQDKSAFDKIVKERAKEIQEMQAQQAAIERQRNAWTGGYIAASGTGGYPWANAPLNCFAGGYCYSPVVDSWALFARQCTSYTAWKLASQGYKVRSFAGQGHAYQWPATTSSYTTQRVGDPRAGDAAVDRSGGGGYGHVMYVESVEADSIIISEYNWIPNSYSSRRIPKNIYQYYTFISFPR